MRDISDKLKYGYNGSNATGVTIKNLANGTYNPFEGLSKDTFTKEYYEFDFDTELDLFTFNAGISTAFGAEQQDVEEEYDSPKEYIRV